tara:strand:+ start:426 stop:776 length:351 start_codon:yes stop_codon:yes gene_type:complete
MLLFVLAYVVFRTNACAKGFNAVNNATTAMQMTLTNSMFLYAGSEADFDEELCTADKNYSVTVQQRFNNMVYGIQIEKEDFASKLITLVVMFLFVSIMCAFVLSGYRSQEDFDSYR